VRGELFPLLFYVVLFAIAIVCGTALFAWTLMFMGVI